MFKIVSVARIREIEALVDEKLMPYADMMERAGKVTAERAHAMIENIENPKVTVLVGGGNNGGDGLVSARYLHEYAEVRLFLLKARTNDDANFVATQELGLFTAYAEHDHDGRVLRNMIASSDLVIDALFGIGLNLPLRDSAKKILRNVNQAINSIREAQTESITLSPLNRYNLPKPPKIQVLAVDCPSGIECDTGKTDSNTIIADETITFIALKPGLVTFPGANYTGDLSVSNIGIPGTFEAFRPETAQIVDAIVVKALLPSRGQNSHKGTFGKTYIVAGSLNYSGAPALSAMAAYRAGTGLVSVATPYPVFGMIAGNILEPTWIALPHNMGVISEKAINVIKENIENYNAILIGPGLGQEDTTGELIKALLTDSRPSKKRKQRTIGFQAGIDKANHEPDDTITLAPLIIDADGLNLLVKIENWWELLPESTIITPHPGEMSRLCDSSTKNVQENRWELAQTKAQEWGIHIVLKGAHTIIATPEGEIFILPFKNDALATAGTGDILAGLIAGLVAQGLSARDAMICGGYIHGLAGEIATADHGNGFTMIASDLLGAIPDAFRQIQNA